MSTWAARYVRLQDRTTDLPKLRKAVGTGGMLVDDGKAPFAVVLIDARRFEPEDLTALSTEFGEALAIAVETIADVVIYDHFVAGKRVRGLSYAGEAGWSRVVGDAEAWETPALFSAAKLEELLLELEEDITEDALAQEKADLEKLWSTGRLVEGHVHPPVDPAALVRAIEKHFKLPARPKG